MAWGDLMIPPVPVKWPWCINWTVSKHHKMEQNVNRVHNWGLWCPTQVSQAGISKCTPQYSVRCNYLSLPEIPAFGTNVLNSWCVQYTYVISNLVLFFLMLFYCFVVPLVSFHNIIWFFYRIGETAALLNRFTFLYFCSLVLWKG